MLFSNAVTQRAQANNYFNYLAAIERNSLPSAAAAERPNCVLFGVFVCNNTVDILDPTINRVFIPKVVWSIF